MSTKLWVKNLIKYLNHALAYLIIAYEIKLPDNPFVSKHPMQRKYQKSYLKKAKK